MAYKRNATMLNDAPSDKLIARARMYSARAAERIQGAVGYEVASWAASSGYWYGMAHEAYDSAQMSLRLERAGRRGT